MKDNFSAHAVDYARYRPDYPPELFQFLLAHVPGRRAAWDCGTGNGQVAGELARHFEQVCATDISATQLQNAVQAPNLRYSVQPAEATDFPPHEFDLAIAAQAIHWFDFDAFYAEVRRTCRPGALVCALGYGVITISEALDAAIRRFYTETVGPYWDAERRYIDAAYRTLPFPFDEIDAPPFASRLRWSLAHLTGYLNTWSAVKHFIRARGFNPVDALQAELQALWGDATLRDVVFPLFLRAGRV